MVAEGDKVVYRYSATGTHTHTGDFKGITATGKQITAAGIVISRIVNGRLWEDWECADEMGLMHQLGVIPQLP